MVSNVSSSFLSENVDRTLHGEMIRDSLQPRFKAWLKETYPEMTCSVTPPKIQRMQAPNDFFQAIPADITAYIIGFLPHVEQRKARALCSKLKHLVDCKTDYWARVEKRFLQRDYPQEILAAIGSIDKLQKLPIVSRKMIKENSFNENLVRRVDSKGRHELILRLANIKNSTIITCQICEKKPNLTQSSQKSIIAWKFKNSATTSPFQGELNRQIATECNEEGGFREDISLKLDLLFKGKPIPEGNPLSDRERIFKWASYKQTLAKQ